jgi:hypothetical protein
MGSTQVKRKYDIPKNFEIDSEIAELIAAHSLKQHYNYAVEDMDNFVLHQKGQPEDYEYNLKLKEALQVVLDYYGV